MCVCVCIYIWYYIYILTIIHPHCAIFNTIVTVRYVTIIYNPCSFNRFLASRWAVAVAQSDASRGKQDNFTKHMPHGIRSVPGNDVSSNVQEMMWLPRFTQSLGGLQKLTNKLFSFSWSGLMTPKLGSLKIKLLKRKTRPGTPLAVG